MNDNDLPEYLREPPNEKKPVSLKRMIFWGALIFLAGAVAAAWVL